MIKFDIDKSSLNDTMLMKYVSLALKKHLEFVRNKLTRRKQYYDGDLPKVPFVINKAKYITDMATEVFIGKQPDIATTAKKQSERNKLIELNKKLKLRHFDRAIFEVGHNAAKYGVGYLLTYTNDCDDFPRFASLDTLTTNVVFEYGVNPDSLFAFTYDRHEANVGGISQDYYKVYVYTDTMFYECQTKDISDLSIAKINHAVDHHFGRTPITMFTNNDELVADAEPVYELINGYNELQNNRKINIDDILKYILLLKNVRVGDEDDQKAMNDLLKNSRVLSIEGDNVDARFLVNPLDQKEAQILAEDLEALIHQISRVPNLTSDKFSMNSSEPALKLKLKGFLDLAKNKERAFTPSLFRVLKMILDFLDRVNNTKYMFNIEEIEFKYSHTLPSSDQEMITQIMNLYNSNMLNPRLALQNVSWIENVEAYISGIEKKEIVVNSGVNLTNIDRQDSVPQDENQKDNLDNFNKGNSQKI